MRICFSRDDLGDLHTNMIKKMFNLEAQNHHLMEEMNHMKVAMRQMVGPLLNLTEDVNLAVAK